MPFTTDAKPREPKKQIGFRIKASLADYIEASGKNEYGGQTRIVEEAVGLHQMLVDRLKPHRERLLRLAGSEGLAWPSEENELLVRLIERALDVEKSKRK